MSSLRSGDRIVVVSWVSSALFATSAIAAAANPKGTFLAIAFSVSIALFVIGLATFAAAYIFAVRRSRHDLMGIGGLFFLQGSAPATARFNLLGSFTLQVVIALATASVRPFSSLAFGILAPMAGLGLCGLWGARHGTFSTR